VTGGAGGAVVPLSASSRMVAWLQIQAKSSNAGAIRVGGASVAAASGLELLAGDTVPALPVADRNVYDLAAVYIWIQIPGEGVNYLCGAL
jgi:hypothetical protein